MYAWKRTERILVLDNFTQACTHCELPALSPWTEQRWSWASVVALLLGEGPAEIKITSVRSQL